MKDEIMNMIRLQTNGMDAVKRMNLLSDIMIDLLQEMNVEEEDLEGFKRAYGYKPPIDIQEV